VVSAFESPPAPGRRPSSFVAPFAWAAVMSVGAILAVVAAMWLMLQ
jgi:hypothetical protein